MKKLVIFTDLDGTLLDAHTYSFKKALPAIKLLKEKDIPLVICSSKTRSEIEYYRKKLSNTHPFISENGGGIFIPKRYFKFKIENLRLKIEENRRYFVIRLGAKYPDLGKALHELRSEGFDVRGFGDMSVREISELTGLGILEAGWAKKREFDETFIFKGDSPALKRLRSRVKSRGFNFTQGEFFHLMGSTDKGRAVEILKKLYSRQFGDIMTIALGDSLNDIEMLEMVDYPIIVKKADGGYERRIKVKNLIKADGIGPNGWNKTITSYLKLCSSEGNAPFSTSSL